MIKRGMVVFPLPLFGYADNATQEEAERLSGGLFQSGIVVFVPSVNGSTQDEVDAHIASMEDVEI